MDEITVCKLASLALIQMVINRMRSALTGSHTLSQQTEQVAVMEKRCTQSQTDVIFVVMNVLVRIYEDDLTAIRNVTAISLNDRHAVCRQDTPQT